MERLINSEIVPQVIEDAAQEYLEGYKGVKDYLYTYEKKEKEDFSFSRINSIVHRMLYKPLCDANYGAVSIGQVLQFSREYQLLTPLIRTRAVQAALEVDKLLMIDKIQKLSEESEERG